MNVENKNVSSLATDVKLIQNVIKDEVDKIQDDFFKLEDFWPGGDVPDFTDDSEFNMYLRECTENHRNMLTGHEDIAKQVDELKGRLENLEEKRKYHLNKKLEEGLKDENIENECVPRLYENNMGTIEKEQFGRYSSDVGRIVDGEPRCHEEMNKPLENVNPLLEPAPYQAPAKIETRPPNVNSPKNHSPPHIFLKPRTQNPIENEGTNYELQDYESARSTDYGQEWDKEGNVNADPQKQCLFRIPTSQRANTEDTSLHLTGNDNEQQSLSHIPVPFRQRDNKEEIGLHLSDNQQQSVSHIPIPFQQRDYSEDTGLTSTSNLYHTLYQIPAPFRQRENTENEQLRNMTRTRSVEKKNKFSKIGGPRNIGKEEGREERFSTEENQDIGGRPNSEVSNWLSTGTKVRSSWWIS